MPKISVVMPLYNAQSHLAEALDSVLSQTISDFEVVAIDDGSTDATPSMLAGYAARDGRVRIVTQANGGIVKALNAGLAAAMGSYIARMDGDDISLPRRFEIQSTYLDAHPECVCIGTHTNLIDESGQLVRSDTAPRGNFRQTDLTRLPPYVATLPHPGIMVRKATMDALGGYRSAFPHAEDYDLFLRMARLGRLAVTDETLLDYRISPHSLSARNMEQQVESACLAVLSAMSVAAGRRDLVDVVARATRADYYAEIADPLLPRMFEHFVKLKLADGHLQRHKNDTARRLAMRSLMETAPLLARHPTSGRVRFYAYRALRTNIRIMLGRA